MLILASNSNQYHLYIGKHSNCSLLAQQSLLKKAIIINDKDIRDILPLLSKPGPAILMIELIGEGISAGQFPLKQFLKQIKKTKRKDPFYLLLSENNVNSLIQPAEYFSRRQFPTWFHFIIMRELSGIDQYGMAICQSVSMTSFDKHLRNALPITNVLNVTNQTISANQFGAFWEENLKRRNFLFSRYFRNGYYCYVQCATFQSQFKNIITEITMPGIKQQPYKSMGDIYLRIRQLPHFSMTKTLNLLVKKWEARYDQAGYQFQSVKLNSGYFLTAVTIEGKKRQVPYLRISPGIEDILQIQSFIESFLMTLKELYETTII